MLKLMEGRDRVRAAADVGGSKPKVEKSRCASALDMIGYGARFHKPRKAEEWMKELREGEED